MLSWYGFHVVVVVVIIIIIKHKGMWTIGGETHFRSYVHRHGIRTTSKVLSGMTLCET
jgi:hypothetical protein